ncbi:hypothetical protein [Lysinibacillus endophyticus]|uniref:Uncharacterized protein n=1 Tax=Ureibacillus endophyticus TaxID=1978490 RepID=A0A494Z7I5_9BACL|nr:hypothetical protein [Lysinibacillus endophyticus]MCP1145049.1 hypothetical protein [Lysinibacillus endophyticus]RKQ18473.1 hypothetical protein D8M03_05355 [Lysinibacillus endophyticus]
MVKRKNKQNQFANNHEEFGLEAEFNNNREEFGEEIDFNRSRNRDEFANQEQKHNRRKNR